MTSPLWWENTGHEELYAMVQQGAGREASLAAEERWSRIADIVTAAEERITRALRTSADGWRGTAADSARTSLGTLNSWAMDAVGDAQLTAGAVAAQAEHAARLRTVMPVPTSEEERVRVHADAFSGTPDSTRARDDMVARDRAGEEDARRLMHDYSNHSGQNQGRLDYWTVPPAVTVDTTPLPPQGVSGGVGDAGAAVPGGAASGGTAAGSPPGAPLPVDGDAATPVAAIGGVGPGGTAAGAGLAPGVGAAGTAAAGAAAGGAAGGPAAGGPAAGVLPGPAGPHPGAAAGAAGLAPGAGGRGRGSPPGAAAGRGPGAAGTARSPGSATGTGAPPGRGIGPAAPGRLHPDTAVGRTGPGGGRTGVSGGAAPWGAGAVPANGGLRAGTAPWGGAGAAGGWRDVVAHHADAADRTPATRPAEPHPSPGRGGGVPADEPHRSQRPPATAAGHGMYPPMAAGAGGIGQAQERRRPGYLIDDSGAFTDDRWFTEPVLTPDDPMPSRHHG